MRILRFQADDGSFRLAREVATDRVELLSGTLFDPSDPLVPTGQSRPMPDSLLSPLEPANIFAIGLNYAEHAREGGREPPPRPVVFMKATSALNHPGSPIHIPACQMSGPEVDYECELAVVVGRPAHNVFERDALDFVFGYTCANDVSARCWQMEGGGGQWIRGKSFDTFCPLGPVLVTADEIPDPQALRIRTTLNGKVMQDGHTADMIFAVKALIAFISQDTTLQPGTVILTGTPSGVGFARRPPVWLKDGDEVVVEVEGIGRLENQVKG